MRRLVPPPHESWHADRDASGQWRVLDTRGQEPLRSTDPLVRIEAVHLAASAPQLAAALRWLVDDFHQLELRSVHLAHRVRLNFAEVVLIEARPQLEEWLRLHRSQQSELDLAA